MSRAGKNVLIVEDDESYRMLLSDALSGAGYDVIAARDGHEALERVKEKPDLILLDYMIPGLTGAEVLKNVRGENSVWAKQVPIYMLTVKDDLSTMAETMAEHMSGYITKSGEDFSKVLEVVKRELR